MDIKDFILITGGALITLVVAHGFWIAYRAKKEPLRMDIVPDLIPDDVDDMERLRGELPNGGARVIQKRLPPSQGDLELDLPLLSDEAIFDESVSDAAGDGSVALDAEPAGDQRNHSAPAFKPTVHQAPPRRLDREPYLGEELVAEHSEPEAERADEDLNKIPEPISGQESVQVATATVAEVQLDLVPANDSEPAQHDIETPARNTADGSRASGQKSRRERTPAAKSPDDMPALNREVEELLVVHLIAPKGEPFKGEALVNALRSQGLRFGDMSIFHRIDPATKVKQFSVANIVEPGTFDMADLDKLQTAGMSFFLQLPGPDSAMDAYEDMLMTIRNVSVELGGEIRDENLSMLTRQGAEHMRQRISDFARKRLSKRVS